MNLKSTRKLLSCIIAGIIAVCLSVASISLIASATVTNKSFYIKNIASSSLSTAVNNQLSKKYEVLSKKSGIPADVFNSVTTAFDTTESVRQATSYLFDENDETLYSDNKVDFFYDSCVEYLDANKCTYNEQSLRNVAKEATKIYSDTVGLHNMGGIDSFVINEKTVVIRVFSVCTVFAIVFAVLLMMIYREKEKAMLYIGSGIIGAGVADVISVALLFITNISSKYNLSPEVYNAVFKGMTNKCLLYGVGAGVVLLALGCLVFSMGVTRINRNKKRTDTRFFKIVDKL